MQNRPVKEECMFKVQDFMTTPVICTEPDARITDVLDIMKKNNLHRIPVTDANGTLVGLITEGMISGAGGSATSLSIYELNYLLSKTKVKTVMQKRVATIHPENLMEKATEKMLKEDIGCLPVVDDHNKVVGILTQNDVFKSFLEVLGWYREGIRVALEAKDEIGQLEKISKVFADEGINIANIGVYDTTNGNASMIIRADKATDGLKQALEDAGYMDVEIAKAE
jgi:acetoin utilization protein AcuB